MVKVERVVVVVTADTKNFGFLSSSDKRLGLIVGEISGIGISASVSLLPCFTARVRITWRVNVSAV